LLHFESTNIPLVAWLGWIMHEKHGDKGHSLSVEGTWRRMDEAYSYGVDLSKKKIP